MRVSAIARLTRPSYIGLNVLSLLLNMNETCAQTLIENFEEKKFKILDFSEKCLFFVVFLIFLQQK